MKTVSAAIAAAIIATAFVPATASAAGFIRQAPVEKAATATKVGYYGGGGYYYNSYPRYNRRSYGYGYNYNYGGGYGYGY